MYVKELSIGVELAIFKHLLDPLGYLTTGVRLFKTAISANRRLSC